MLNRIPPPTPKLPDSEIGSKPGVSCHSDQCQVPITEPTMKAASVMSMRALPPPAVNKVPEAQPPPSCMPRPNRKAPQITARLSGETLPRRAMPPISPWAIRGVNTSTVTAIMIICARSPALCPLLATSRQAAVKPKAA